MFFLKNKKWFTFAELVVSIWISLILMLGVGVFITSWLKNITSQKKILDSSSEISSFYEKISQNFNWDFKFLTWSSNGLFLKNSFFYWNWNFTVIKSSSFTWDCLIWDNLTWSYLVDYNFTPFEGINGDLFWSGIIYDDSELKVNFFSNDLDYNWIKNKNFFESITWIAKDWDNYYVADSKKHWVYKIPKLDFSKEPEIIIWKWVYWDFYKSWANWLDVYLNNPTWLEIIWNILFVSDTGNNRILEYNLSNKKINIFMDYKNWLHNPTWIFHDRVNNVFYISNSWKWEIYEILLESKQPLKLNLSFDIPNPKFNVNNLTITPSLWNINSSYLISDFKLTNNWSDIWVLTWEILWSWLKLSFNDTNIDVWKLNIEIDNLKFTWSWSVYFKLDFNWETLYSYWFTSWDGSIFTKNDNVLRVINWFSYPTWIYSPDNSLIYVNDFIARKSLLVKWHGISKNLENINLDYFNFIKSNIRIKDFLFNYDNLRNFLNIKINYYKTFDCIDSTKNVEWTVLVKKNL